VAPGLFSVAQSSKFGRDSKRRQTGSVRALPIKIRSGILGYAPWGLLLALQVLDSGRNNFGLVLLAIVSAVAVMQVAIDPDKPAFGAFLNYFLRQF
jgi:hypothetical protein